MNEQAFSDRGQLTQEDVERLRNIFHDIGKLVKEVAELPVTIGKDIDVVIKKVEQNPGIILRDFQNLSRDFEKFAKSGRAAISSVEGVAAEVIEQGIRELDKLKDLSAGESEDLARPLADTRAKIVTAMTDLLEAPGLVKKIDVTNLLGPDNPSIGVLKTQIESVPEFPFSAKITSDVVHGLGDVLVVPVYVLTLGNEHWHKLPSSANAQLSEIIRNIEQLKAAEPGDRVAAFRGASSGLLIVGYIFQTLTNLAQQFTDAMPNYTVGIDFVGEGATATIPKAASLWWMYLIVFVLNWITDTLNLIAEIVLIYEPESSGQGAATAAAIARLSRSAGKR